MSTIDPLFGAASGAGRGVGRRAAASPGAGGFALPPLPAPSGTAPGPADGRAAGPTADGAGGLESLLLLQEAAFIEAPADALARDRAARDRAAHRRARDLLGALAALQQSLLAGDDGGAVARLRGLLDELPVAADPTLAALAGAIVLRARVELARRGD